MHLLWKYSKGYRIRLILGPFFKLIEACLELLVPIIMTTMINRAYGIDTFIGGIEIKLSVVQCAIFMVADTLLGYIFALFCQYFAAVGSMGFGAQLRSALFSHITKLSHKEIDSVGTSSYINRITNDVNQLQLAVAMVVRLVFRAPVLAVGAFVMSFIINRNIAIIFGISVPIVTAFIFIILKITVSMHRKVQKDLDKISVVTRENLTGARVIRAFSRQEKEMERGSKATEVFYKDSVKVNKISALLNPFASFMMNLCIAVIVVIGARQVAAGSITSAEISAFVTYILWILLALTIIANMSVLITRSMASGERLQEILDLQSSINDGEEKIELTDDTDAISFNKVFFRYNKTEYVLKNISFEAKIGQTLALIGGTGSGKSTIAALICRFYDAESGEIKLFGKDIKSLSQYDIRDNVALVVQNSTLLSGTLRENIAWGDSEANDERIIESLKFAEAWEFVKKLKDGLDTKVLSGGKNFSGGQQQRLTIARAIYRQSKLLVLDDSASALDFATDARLRKNLKKLAKTMCVVIISQRAGTVKHADKIFVLDKGECDGYGTHKELLKISPVYKEICLSQFNEEEL